MAEKKIKFPAQFLGPSYSGRVKRANAERTVNLYLEINPINTGTNGETGVLIGTPGLTLLNTIGTGPIRAVYTDNDIDAVWVVSGNTIYRLTGPNLQTVQTAGTMKTSVGPVRIADNGVSVVFVDGQYGYYTSVVQAANTTVGALISGGSGYINGTYTNTAVAGGTGTGLTADVIVQSNTIVQFIVNNPGTGYQAGDTLNLSSLGGTGFAISVTAVPLHVTNITDPHFYPASSVEFQDGYFIFNQVGTAGFFISDINSIAMLPFNVANKSGSPDNIQGIITLNRILYLVGQSTIETWWDSGQSGSTPFARQDGQYNQVGCIAPQTIRRLFNSFIWLGQSPEGGAVVYQMQNSQATRISNHALEYYMQNLNSTVDISNSTAYTWQSEGHQFYALNLTGADTTWVFDLSTGQWCEQQSTVGGVQTRHIGETHCYWNGKHIIGDYKNGNIYYYDYNNYTDNGAPITRIRQAPHIVDNLNNLFYKLFQIHFTPGTGIQSGTANAVTPRVILEISDDGGETWKAPMYASIGAIGAYTTRARWQRLGYSRDRIFRVSCSDPIKFDIVSAILDVEVGNA